MRVRAESEYVQPFDNKHLILSDSEEEELLSCCRSSLRESDPLDDHPGATLRDLGVNDGDNTLGLVLYGVLWRDV